MRARIDFEHPTYECCDLLFEYRDEDTHCAICGQPFDWEDLLEAYNPEDYEEEPDGSYEFEQMNLWDSYGDVKGAAASDLQDEEVYLASPWAEKDWFSTTARSPTLHSTPSAHRPSLPDLMMVDLPGGQI